MSSKIKSAGQCPANFKKSKYSLPFLFRSDFAGATMCAECLLLLSQAPPWKLPISLTINQYLQTSPQDMDLSSVFALLVIAGFPRVCPCLLYKC